MKKISPSLALHFFSYVLYLFFFRIIEDKETMFLFKPVILASLAFYYLNYSGIKRDFLHIIIIVLCFISDNLNLLGELLLHEIAIVLYLLILFVLFFLIVKDSKLLKKGAKIEKYFGVIVFVAILLFLISKFTTSFIIKTKISHYYVILNYIVIFTGVLILSFYNLFKHKTASSKFLVFWMLTLFMADLLAVINSYYFHFKPLIYLSCIFELPTYYFMVRYFIARDKEKLNRNVLG